jgi:hypothetical protein
MNGIFADIIATIGQSPPENSASIGKWVFVVALGLLLVWLLLMPRRLIGQAAGVPPWWRNVRVWAIVVTVIQIMVYAYFG